MSLLSASERVKNDTLGGHSFAEGVLEKYHIRTGTDWGMNASLAVRTAASLRTVLSFVPETEVFAKQLMKQSHFRYDISMGE